MAAEPREPADSTLLAELGWVRSLARRLLADPHLVDDVVQDTWLLAQQHEARGEVRGLRAWLAVVVRNRVHRLARTDRRRIARERLAAGEVAATAPDVVERGAMYRELTQVVMELEEPYRSAILLRFLDDLPAPEIAARQGVSHDAARKRISRGLEMLRRRLGDAHRGGFAAWSLAWSQHLGVAAPGAALPAPLLLGAWITMQTKWIAAAVAVVALVGFSVRSMWPDAPQLPPGADVAALPAGAEIQAAPARQAERSALPAPARLAVEVVDAAGRPVVGVLAMALADGDLVRSLRTDAAGRAEFDGDAAVAEVLLAEPGAVPTRHAVLAGTSPLRVVYPHGEVVAGRVQMPAGERPGALRIEHDPVAVWAQGLGPRALRELAALGIEPESATLPLSGPGTFGFRGLPADWSGALSIDGGWTLRDVRRRERATAGTGLVLQRPMRDLELELFAPIFVRGRVLAMGSPVAGFAVHVLWSSSFAGRHSVGSSGADGRFEVAIGRPLPGRTAQAELLVRLPAGGVLLQQMVRARAEDAMLDLGDLEVGHPFGVVVTGLGGEPIAGAAVHVVTAASGFLGATTDEHGRADLPMLPPHTRHLAVRARGHRSALLEPPFGSEASVRLEAGSGIDVTVSEPDGSPAVGVKVRLEADVMPFVVPGATVNLRPRAFQQVFPLDERGRLELVDLVPGVALRCVVVDELGEAFERADVVGPPVGRVDRLAMTLREPAYHLIGCVRNAQGKPVARASVHAERGDFALHDRTKGDGLFRLGPLRGRLDGLRLEVEHAFAVPWVRQDVVAAPGAEPVEVTLVAGRTLCARIVQADGSPVAALDVFCTPEGGANRLGRAADPGVFWFDQLEPGPATLAVKLGGRRFERAVDARAEHVELRVPLLATLSIAVGSIEVSAGSRVCVVVTPAEPAGEPERHYFAPASGAGPLALSLQVPAGRYRLQLESRTFGASRPRVQQLGASRELEAEAGRWLEVVLP